jgi:hypothetical protein
LDDFRTSWLRCTVPDEDFFSEPERVTVLWVASFLVELFSDLFSRPDLVACGYAVIPAIRIIAKIK